MDIAVETRDNGYQVDLGVFHGPLDLLLYLLKKEEVELIGGSTDDSEIREPN